MKKAIVPLGIIILVIFGVFMYLNRFTIFHVSDVNGYVFNTNNIAANLSAGLTENSEKVTYENVKVSDTIYQSGKKYYIGEETKKNVNLDYPIISEDTSSVYVLNDNGQYIDSNFIKETTYQNSVFTEGYLYNGTNLQRMSEDKYYFIELHNGIFVNLVELRVKSNGKETIIPVNSFIYFEQSFLRYYKLENKQYSYYELPNILDKNKIYVGEDEYTYYDLLIFLEVISSKVDKIEIEEEVELAPERPPVVIAPSTTTPSQGLVGGETPSGGHIVEEEYVKPVVTLENTGVGVYSYNGDLTIYDPTNRIYKTPTLEYKQKGNVYLRNSFNKAGHIETVGLMPNTTYEVTGYYYYHDEFQNKMKNTFLETTFTTGDIGSLENYKINVGGTTPDINFVTINDITTKNKKTDEVLKGLKSGYVVLETTGKPKVQLKLNTGDITDIVNIKKFDYKTDQILNSNTKYRGYIELYDIANNKMTVEGSDFEFITLKSPPTAKINSSLSKNFTVADLKIEVRNPDKMENAHFYYRAFNINGEMLNSLDHNGNGVLEEGMNTIQLRNLYAESTYRIFVYADYLNMDGEYVTEYVMDSTEFITYDVSRLGSIDFTVNVPEVTQTYAQLQMSYSKYNTENPVYELISNYIRLEIYDAQDKNPDKEPLFTERYSKSDFISGVTVWLGEGFTENFSISTDATYSIDLVPVIVSGGKEYEVSRTLTTREFETLKDDAQVYIKNGFIASGYVDFDVCVEDIDGAIIGNEVVVKIQKDSDNIKYQQIIEKKSACTPREGESDTQVYTRISVKGLENDGYEVVFEAPKYNIGNSDRTLLNNHQMRKEDVDIRGTTADLSLNKLINMINYETTVYENGSLSEGIIGVNLFDISNNTRWKSVGGTYTTDLKEIKIEEEEVVLQAYKGWRMYSYYLPELVSRDFVLSFEFDYEIGTETDQKICINFDDDSSRCDIDITSDLVEHENERLTYSVDPTKYNIKEYISFYIKENDSKSMYTTLTLKKVKLEIGTNGVASDYTSFGDKGTEDGYTPAYAGTFAAEFDEIITERANVNPDVELYFNDATYDYLIRYFKNGEEVTDLQREINFEKYDVSGQLVKRIWDNYDLLDIEADVDFEAKLSIRTHLQDGTEEGFDRFYDLKTVEFTTEAETRTIENITDFYNMHMYGYYLVANDLDFTNTTQKYENTFQGSIDFQGHKVTLGLEKGPSYLFYRIGGGGTVKNVDVHYILNGESLRTQYYGLVHENYGLITNARFIVDSTTQPKRQRSYEVTDNTTDPPTIKTEYYNELTGHDYFSLFGDENYGTIENIVVELNSNLYCRKDCSAGVLYNYGIIKNGYITGKNIKAGFTADGQSKNVGVIAVTSGSNSKIENFYSLIDVELGNGIDDKKSTEYTVGNIVYNASGAEISNVIVVDPRIVYSSNNDYLYNTTYRDHNKDVNFSTVSTSSMIENVYYIGNFNYNNTKSEDGTISHLSNSSFLSARLNSENKFNVAQAWKSGVFPQLIWPEYMPSQKTITIPKKNESSYMKILSVDSVIQDKNHSSFGAEYTEEQKAEIKSKYFARVQVSVYNPRSYKIAGFKINGIGTSANADEIMIASQTTGNTDKIQVLTFYVKTPEKFKTRYTVEDIYLNKPNDNNIMGAYSASCKNNGITNEIDCDDLPVLNLDLYKYVSSIEDIISAQNNNHENFRLSQDLDLSSNNNAYISKIVGVLDGNGHTISNIKSNDCFIGELQGTIKNINVDTLTIKEDAGSYENYGALICKSTSGAIVDNVHVSNVKTTAGTTKSSELYISGLVGTATSTKIRNSSVSTIEVLNVAKMQNREAYAGGLVAKSTSTNISNSFVRNLNFKLESYVPGDNTTSPATPPVYGVKSYIAVGGIVGEMSSGIVENVYVTGTIDTKFGTVGGIVGQTNGYVRGAISKVNIYTIGDNVGGILGMLTSLENTNLVSKTLVLGDILTSAESFSAVERTSGTQITPNQNFAWDKQSMNSLVSANTKMEELLSEDDLGNPIIYSSKIGLSEYDFAVSVDKYKKKYENVETKENLVADGREYGIIPKLLHSSTGEILNNQDVGEDTEIHYIELFALLGDPDYDYYQFAGESNDYGDDIMVDINKPWEGEYVQLMLKIKNVNKRAINSVSMENMTVLPGSFSYSQVDDDDTIYTLTFAAQAVENQNYDSYKITSINWVTDDGPVEPYRTAIKLVIPFYGRIDEPSDWQSIKTGTFQNFVIAKDIDLSSYNSNNANINVSFNKLIGLNQTDEETGEQRAPIISGITRTNLSAGTAVIDTIVSEINNVSFDNISLTAASGKTGNYFAIIKFLNGKMLGSLDQTTGRYQRMIFSNINLDGQKISYVGIIGVNKSPDIHYIEYKNINIRGNQYVGGFIARSYSFDKTDIIGSNIIVYGASTYVGGFIAYETYVWGKLYTFHVTLTGINIDGGHQTGGAFGYAGGNYITVIGTEDTYLTKTMNVVNGRSSYIGGVAGRYNTGSPYYNYAYHLKVTSNSSGVGGLAGYRYNAYYCAVVDCEVTGTDSVGGISGTSGYGAYYCTVAGGIIRGYSNVGGISGRVNWGNVQDCHVGQYGLDVTIIQGIDRTNADGSITYSYNIGGIVGGNDTNPNSNQRNEVMAKIIGGYQIGGIVGYSENRIEASNDKRHYTVDNIVANVSIQSTRPTKAYVGGLIGRVEKNFPYNYLNDNVISVSIKTAAPDHVGYIIGGSEYVYTYDVKDSSGNVMETIRKDYSTTNGDTMLYQVGADGTTVESKATRLKLYEGSTVNGIQYGSPDVLYTIPTESTTKITFAQLTTWSTYTSIISTSYIERDRGESTATTGLVYYPFVKRAQLAYDYTNVITNNLPGTDDVTYSGGETPLYHALPDFEVYAVDVDKINIEFKNTDEFTNLIVNGQSYRVDQNVFTFYYDFKEDFEVTIADTYNKKTTLISADDVKNGVTIIGEYYYYLKDGEVITNNEEKPEDDDIIPDYDNPDYETDGPVQIPVQNGTQNSEEDSNKEVSSSETVSNNSSPGFDIVSYVTRGITPLSIGKAKTINRLAVSDTNEETTTIVNNAMNIYGDEILLEDKSVYNITTGETYKNDFNNLTLADTESLYEYNYANQRIETFYYYSLINGKKVDKQLFVKNGQIEIVSSNIDNKKNQILVDNYNDKNYLIYLGEDGKLYSLKDDIEFPKGFKNINIKSISTNAQTNTDIMLVEYNDGSYTIFNYRTGQLLSKQSDENMSLQEYISQYLEISFDDILATGNKNSSYEEAKKLVAKLNSRPVSTFYDEDMTGVLTSKKYSIAYDPGTNKYYVYELPGENDSSSNSLTHSLNTTIDSIIDENPLMIEYYRESDGKKVSLLSSILIVLGIVLGIAGAVLVLGKNVKKDKKKTNIEKEAKA